MPSHPGHDHRGLGRAEAVHDVAVEAARELLDVPVAGLVAERDAQRVVGVVGLLGRGQDVGQRLADVVHVRRAVVPDVVEEPGRREPRRHDRRAAARRDRPAGDDRVGVEQRHRDVADVVAGEREPVDQVGAREQREDVRDLDGLGLAAGARGEDHHERVHRADLGVRHERPGGGDLLGPLGRVHVDDPHVRTRSSPSSSSACSPSTRTIWQSARRTSASSASPRRVVFRPPRT